MKKGLLISGIVATASLLVLSSRSRGALAQMVDGEAFNKAYEMKNIMTDWKKNQ